jgi:hypothetical protein
MSLQSRHRHRSRHNSFYRRPAIWGLAGRTSAQEAADPSYPSRVAAVFGARSLIAGIKSAESAVGPEDGPVPEIRQAEDAGPNAPRPCCGVALQQLKFLEPLEYPEGEIDLDAMWVEDLAVEFVRQSSANQQLVDFGAPARSRRSLLQNLAAVMTDHVPQKKRKCSSKTLSSRFGSNQIFLREIQLYEKSV